MLQGPILKNIIRYTVPIILTSVLQLLFNAADLIVVGRYSGNLSLAAVGATGALTNLMVNLFLGLSVGVGVGVAHGIGAREDESVSRTVHTAIPAALIGGGILSVVGVLFSRTFLNWMGTPTGVIGLSTTYMQIYFSGMIFVMLYNFAASILRAVGDTKSPLIYLTIAGVINVGLNLIFVIVFDMNVAGVALATIISQAISAVLVLRALIRRTDACRFVWRKMRIYKEQLAKILRIGLPAGMQSALFNISNVMIQSSINSFGDILMTGNTAAANIEGFVYVSLNAFQQTAVNFVGQNMGAHQYDRVKRIAKTCLLSVLTVGTVVGVAAYLLGPVLLPIYITDSAQALEYGLLRLSIVCTTYAICGLMDTATGILRGMGAALAPMAICILGVCGVRIGWITTLFRLPQFHTPASLYASFPVSWVLTFGIEFLVILHLYKRYAPKEKERIK